MTRMRQELAWARHELRLRERERTLLRSELRQTRRQLQQMGDRIGRIGEQRSQNLVAQRYRQQRRAIAMRGYGNVWPYAGTPRQQRVAFASQQAYLAQPRQPLEQMQPARSGHAERIAKPARPPENRPAPAVAIAQAPLANDLLRANPQTRLPSSVAIAQLSTAQSGNDRDRDGVADGLDLCPDSPTQQQPGATGCNMDEPLRIEGVSFGYDSYRLSDESRQALDKVAGILKQHPDLKVEVAGHTDSQGNPDYNVWLSQKRAEAVREYLRDEGVSADNLQAKGYGGDHPVADNNTLAGLRINRRVELHWLL